MLFGLECFVEYFVFFKRFFKWSWGWGKLLYINWEVLVLRIRIGMQFKGVGRDKGQVGRCLGSWEVERRV